MERETILLSQQQRARLFEEALIAELQLKSENLADVEEGLATMQPQLDELESQIRDTSTRLASLRGQAQAERLKLSSLEE